MKENKEKCAEFFTKEMKAQKTAEEICLSIQVHRTENEEEKDMILRDG